MNGAMWRRDAHDGHTLLEVLVALTITITGVLGIAALLLYGLSAHQSARQYETADRLLTDISEQMRANPAAADAYATDRYPAGARTQGCATTHDCPPMALAEHQLAQWQAEIATRLPAIPEGAARGEIVAQPSFQNAAMWRLSLSWGNAAQREPAALGRLLALPRPP